MRVYLAHPHDLDVSSLKKKLESLGIYVYDPMQHEDDLAERWLKASRYEIGLEEVCGEIVEKNLTNILMSDVVVGVVKNDRPCIGTAMEMMYAWMQGIPVYVLVKSRDRYLRHHPFLYSLATVFTSESELVRELRKVVRVVRTSG